MTKISYNTTNVKNMKIKLQDSDVWKNVDKKMSDLQPGQQQQAQIINSYTNVFEDIGLPQRTHFNCET